MDLTWLKTLDWKWIVTTAIAVAALIIPQIEKVTGPRYRPHWGRAGDVVGETHRVFNNTDEAAEDVVLEAVNPRFPDLPYSLARQERVPAGGDVEYVIPGNVEGWVQVRWRRSSTRRLYAQDLVEPDNRPFRQRLGQRIAGQRYPSHKGRRYRG